MVLWTGSAGFSVTVFDRGGSQRIPEPTWEILSAGEVGDFLQSCGAAGFDLRLTSLAAKAGLLLGWGFGVAALSIGLLAIHVCVKVGGKDWKCCVGVCRLQSRLIKMIFRHLKFEIMSMSKVDLSVRVSE